MVRGWETPDPAKNIVTETQKKFMSWKLQKLARGTGWLKLWVLILAGLIVANACWAQQGISFYLPVVLVGDYDSGGLDTGGWLPYYPDGGCPNIAGLLPQHAGLVSMDRACRRRGGIGHHRQLRRYQRHSAEHGARGFYRQPKRYHQLEPGGRQ